MERRKETKRLQYTCTGEDINDSGGRQKIKIPGTSEKSSDSATRWQNSLSSRRNKKKQSFLLTFYSGMKNLKSEKTLNTVFHHRHRPPACVLLSRLSLHFSCQRDTSPAISSKTWIQFDNNRLLPGGMQGCEYPCRRSLEHIIQHNAEEEGDTRSKNQRLQIRLRRLSCQCGS